MRNLKTIVLCCVLVALAGSARADDEGGGLIGRPINGRARITDEKLTPSSATITLEYGRAGGRPYAMRRITLAPRVSRTDTQCVANPGAKVEGLKETGPGGLGEITWGIDLQDADGGVVQGVTFVSETQGGGQEPTAGKNGNGGWAIDLAKDAAMPGEIVVRIKWFDATNSYSFPVTKAISDASKSDPPAPGDPAKGAAGESGKGTHLTIKELTWGPQSLPGYWKIKFSLAEDEQPTFALFDMSDGPTMLRLLNAKDRKGSYGWLRWSTDCWRGQAYIISTTHKECRDKGYMEPAAGRASADNLRFEGEWRGRKIDDKCKLTEDPDNGPLKWERFVGITFVPIKPGKFIYTIQAPAVGPNPAQWKGMVKLAWDYGAVGAKHVKLSHGEFVDPAWDVNSPTFDPAKLSAADQAKLEDAKFVADLKKKLRRTSQDYTGATGEFDMVTDHPGTYTLDVQIIDDQGKVIHVDHATAEIPG